MSNPLISVVIPVFNRLFELDRAIKSVLNQSLQDFEILVVDDFSTEDITAVLDKFSDNRIHYFRLLNKGNANVCRNLGLNNAKGEYVAMLDSDDEWTANHLESKLNYLLNKSADGVFGSFYRDNGKQKIEQLSRPFFKNEKMVNYLLSDVHAQTSTHFYKTACAKQIGWDETLHRHQDWDFNVRFAAKFKFVPCYDFTCIVHWKAGERRAEHFDSIMRFIQKNKTDIDPVLYSKYHRGYYTYILSKNDIPEKYKNHYKKEGLRYIDAISLRDFLGTYGANKSKIARFLLRIEFVIRVLLK
ncbi:MAG: glycosyltransferase family 2 protein [Bacteroidota bacterium]